MIKQLHIRNMIRVERPIYFQTRFADALLVEPSVVNLRSKCEYWYVLGYKLCKCETKKSLTNRTITNLTRSKSSGPSCATSSSASSTKSTRPKCICIDGETTTKRRSGGRF